MAISLNKPREILERFISGPVDIASLAAFRFLFGLLMAAAMVRFLAKGWIRLLYIEPRFFFSYPGLEWLRPWPGFLMHVHFIVLAILALGIAFGIFYRVCIALFFLGFTYVELLDQTAYLNHYYLISLLSGLLIFLPAHRAWSIDVWRKPQLRLEAVPAWCLNLLRFQVAVVYVFAGLAKFNADWLLRAEPLRIWLPARSDLPLVGPWLGQAWVAYGASWFGALFDTSIVFCLLWRRTRWPAYALLVLFHVATWVLFNIGMFPWIMIVAALLLFPADWPRRWLAWLRGRGADSQTALSPQRGGARDEISFGLWSDRPCSFLLVLLAAYAAVQVALPLRPWLVSQPSAWTCAGFNCAWRVMIAEKTGYAEFYAFDPSTSRRWRLSVKNFLTPRQETLMAQDPYLVRAMGRRLAADLKARGLVQAQVTVDAFAALNGRPSQPLIDPNVNLAGPVPDGWIVPLRQAE
ncbi:MAG TPA: HTTM domain-containing protein [Verrucomicrobiae bacterium]|nr:HTTM domain-containing protein [Verrucomicrobiae bacterium]